MSDTPLPGTWGGPAFKVRGQRHEQELNNALWRKCGVNSECTALTSVTLGWPGDILGHISNPNEALLLRPVNLERIREQTLAIKAAYEAQGVEVTISRCDAPLPNFIFMRDLYFMTPEGAILARPAAQQRAGEERYAARTLAAMGVPILTTLRGNCSFEGADALWLDHKTVLIGTDLRTNNEAVSHITPLLATMGIDVLTTSMPGNQQHLLGIMNFIDHNLVAVDSNRAPPELISLLKSRSIDIIALENEQELREKRGMNFVTLKPREILMPANCPNIQRALHRHDVTTHQVDVSEYLNAGGGLACLTGIISRT